MSILDGVDGGEGVEGVFVICAFKQICCAVLGALLNLTHMGLNPQLVV